MLSRMSIVLAEWCPHCVPASLEVCEKLAKDLKVPLRVLDIDDPQAELVADRIVKEHGDFVEDYLVPQVFLEYDDGRVQHIFTGFSEGVHVTRSKWNDFQESNRYKNLLNVQTR